MPKRLGYIEDKPDRRDLDIDILGLSSEELPEESSLKSYVPEVFDQMDSNSCVANAVAAAIGILEAKARLVYAPVSRLFAYYNSRRLHGGHIFDDGTYIRTCLTMMNKLGIPDEKYWEFSTSWLKLGRRPSWNAYMMANPRKNGTYVRIFDIGDQRIEAIKSAINAGYPVVFGTKVDKEYLNSQGPLRVSRPTDHESIVGGHAQVIVGYQQIPGNGLYFEVLNSWSSGWRNKGFIWMSEDYITWGRTKDLQIVKGWNKLQSKRGMFDVD